MCLNKIDEHDLDVEPDLEGGNKDDERDESIASPNKKLKEDIKTTYLDLSRSPRFEFMKKSSSSTSKFSTSFASHMKSDIKGVSLINELNQIIEVGTALGLKDFVHHNDGSYIFFGDMNVVRNEQERRNHMINGLMVDGTWITDPKLIKDTFLQFYEVKFQAQDDQGFFPNLPHSLTLDNRDWDNLE
nr:RNA-directed DNA polymerase, eukaryota, reverse transcriptase zinc-binding domain protein [Tanacetum cinerariifolium]